MSNLEELLQKNREWSEKIREQTPEFFSTLAKQQNPDFLWIGCSDSRVPANQIVDMMPGQLFVHRNVANLVVNNDMNLLSVLQFAVEVLQVEHIIVCGHYGCGGVKASLERQSLGLIDNWLHPIRVICNDHVEELNAIEDEMQRLNRLCELNVIRQVKNLSQINVVQQAWARKQPLTLHGWVYGLDNGLIKDLNASMDSVCTLEEALQFANLSNCCENE